MGQRSQIYIRISNGKNKPPTLIAKYYDWNYGERMISRARYGIEYIKENIDYINLQDVRDKINKIFDVNFDMIDVALTSDILKEYIEEFADEDYANSDIFIQQDNNDGKLFVDVFEDGSIPIKYCFTDYDMNILTPKEYMNWDYKGWETSQYLDKEGVDKCKDNISFLNENATLMTKEELQEFINCDYSKQLVQLADKLGISVDKGMLHSNISLETLDIQEEQDITDNF